MINDRGGWRLYPIVAVLWVVNACRVVKDALTRVVGKGCLVMVVLLLLSTGTHTQSAELQQVIFPHEGMCDGTVHTPIMWTNTTGTAAQIVSTRVLTAGTGFQWAYIQRATDALFLVWAHQVGPSFPTAFEKDVPAATVTLLPGHALQLIHFCLPPDRYLIHAFVEYVMIP